MQGWRLLIAAAVSTALLGSLVHVSHEPAAVANQVQHRTVVPQIRRLQAGAPSAAAKRVVFNALTAAEGPGLQLVRRSSCAHIFGLV